METSYEDWRKVNVSNKETLVVVLQPVWRDINALCETVWQAGYDQCKKDMEQAEVINRQNEG